MCIEVAEIDNNALTSHSKINVPAIEASVSSQQKEKS